MSQTSIVAWLSDLNAWEAPAGSRRPGRLRAAGIDLGTTNCTVAEVSWRAGGRPMARCLELPQETLEGLYTHHLVPSVVALQRGREWVGEGAKRLRARSSELGLEPGRHLFFDCKNEIGLRKTYHRAPEGYRSASEIAGRVLSFLHRSLVADDPTPIDRLVVTVPASFQLAQRRDTLAAATLAGLPLAAGDLLDEPVAAFLAYLMALPADDRPQFGGAANVVVFDFGGGTCDVAVLRVQLAPGGKGIGVAPRAVSRYHRLGGGDIDAAIVHEVLIPELERQNGLGPFELGFEEKKRVLEPSLLSLAESMKIALAAEVARREEFGKASPGELADLVTTQPVTVEVPIGGRSLRLSRPSLPYPELERLAAPFFDRDLLYPKESEYRLTCSIFAPLEDALHQAGLEPSGVEYCLLVGGSSLLPQVRREVTAYFANASVLAWGDRTDLQTAVATGAAWHAFALAASGKGLVTPVCPEPVSLRTADGLFELIAAGVVLPWPGAGRSGTRRGLRVPVGSLTEPVRLRVEVVGGKRTAERALLTSEWVIPAPVSTGAALTLAASLDENQALDLRLSMDERPGVEFACRVENPLSHVVNPLSTRVRLEELEEKIRTGRFPQEIVSAKLIEVAELCAELGQNERALALLGRVLRASSRPRSDLLHRMALLAGMLGDWQKEEKLYREAADLNRGSGASLFNLSLSLGKRNLLLAAHEAAAEAARRAPCGPYLTQLALITRKLGQDWKGMLDRAIAAFPAVDRCDDWELSWLGTAAATGGCDELRSGASAEERRRRHEAGRPAARSDAHLPILEPALVPKE